MKNLGFGKRLRFALAGISYAWRSEASFRFQSCCAALLILLLLALRPPAIWWALFFLCITAVLSAELLNSSIEKLADHLHPERHEAIRIVKDCAAGAVLIASFASVGVGLAFLYSVVW